MKVFISPKVAQEVRDRLTAYLERYGNKVVGTVQGAELLIITADELASYRSTKIDVLVLTTACVADAQALRVAGANHVRSPGATTEKIFQGIL